MSDLREADTPGVELGVRDRLAASAIELFLRNGYECTTVEEITEDAGVGRRTFFRYFASKEDAVFPDHQALIAEVEEFLERTGNLLPPVAAACEAARIVLAAHARNPQLSVKRYELTRSIDALRNREIAVVARYQRAFSAHLRRSYGEDEHGRLRAEVAAAAVLAAHNLVVRDWIRSGARGDTMGRAEQAFDYVRDRFEGAYGDGSPHQSLVEDVVVAVLPRGTPVGQVARRVEQALRRS